MTTSSNQPTCYADMFVTVFADGEYEPFLAIRCDKLEEPEEGILQFFHKNWRDEYILMITVHEYSFYKVEN